MPPTLVRRRAVVGLLMGGAGLVLAGCAEEIVADSLLADNPAAVGVPAGRAPVPPEALLITPTGVPPAAATVIAPDPILPKGDEAWTQRRLPPWADPGSPAERAAEHETWPEGVYQPEPRRRD